jgi:predicted phosphodiesterase
MPSLNPLIGEVSGADSNHATARKSGILRFSLYYSMMLYCIDIEMAEAIPDIDIIVGGHTHSFLYTSKVQVNSCSCHSYGDLTSNLHSQD